MRASALTAIASLAAVALGLLAAAWLPDPLTRERGALLALAAVILGVVAFRQVERLWPRPEAAAPSSAGVRTRRRAWQWLGWGVALGGLILCGWALIDVWRSPFVWNQAWRWLGGLALILVGLWLSGRFVKARVGESAAVVGPRPAGYKLRAVGLEQPHPDDLTSPTDEGRTTNDDSPPPPRLLASSPPRWVQAALVVIVLLAALWFRAYRLQEMPPGIFVDETNAALDALRILDGRPDSLFGTGWFETPNAFVYVQSLYFRIMGATYDAIKVQSVLPGLLTVLAIFFLGREMFGFWPGLIAMAFLAFNRWHFNMSRWGWAEVYPPLFQVLTLLFVLRGARRGRWFDWALAGFFMGAGMYTYLASRLVVVGILLYLGYRVLVDRGFLRRNWPGLALFAGVYALTFAPLAFTYIHNPFTFLNRSEQINIGHDIQLAGGSLQPLWESVKRHLLMFHVSGDFNPRHNLPGAPTLDPITAGFVLLGLAWAVWKWRDHRRGMLIIWVGVTLLGGVLSRLDEAPQAFRTLAAAPALALMAADAFDLGLRGLTLPFRSRRIGRWLWAPVAAVLLVATGWLNYRVYFRDQATNQAVYVAFSPLETTIAREVIAKQEDHRLYLSPRLYYFSPLKFLTYRPNHFVGIALGPWRYTPFTELGGGVDQPAYQLADPGIDLPLPDLGGDSASFLLDVHFQYVLDLFRYYYPGVQSEIVSDRYGAPLYLSVTVPGDEISALQARNRADAAGTIRGLYIPASGEYTLTGPAAIELDGQPLPSGSVFLGKGLHALALRDLPADLSPDAPVLTWTQPLDPNPITVPDSALFRTPPGGNGLLGSYYAGSEWQGEPLMQRVDPLLLTAWPDAEPIYGEFSATWTGDLLVPTDGAYTFQLNADDGVRFTLDGQLVGESLNPDTVNMISSTLNLTAGSHPIRLDYFQRGGGKAFEFFWQPPGQPMQPVASQYLRPAAP